MKVYRTTDPEFSAYGRKIEFEDTCEIIAEAKKISLPEVGSNYTASVESLEKLSVSKLICDRIYGELPIEVGICLGFSESLNALEWHNSSEINIAVTDFILLLGKLCDFKGGRYESENIKAFLVKKGEMIEVFADTMHFCPLNTEKSGFSCIVVLPKGTNIPLERETKEEYLFRKNKWLIAHVENRALLEKGVKGGIYGKNISFSDLNL